MARVADRQHDRQADQHALGRERDGWAEDRRKIAADRYREPLISAAITTIGLLLVGGLPLLACIYLLRAVHKSEACDAILAEVLIDEILAEKPRLLPPPVSVARAAPPRLKNTSAETEPDFEDIDADR